ncbi:MAG: hypothetical protein IKJ65_01975 [Clostridia bacterium]|nr:hypothetical protein [Clostridia bacterium]
MAASGTIQQAIRTGYRIQIAWTVDSQSEANNTSTVTAKVQLVSTGSSYTINSTASKSGSLTINGTKYTFSFTAALSGNQTKTLFTKTVTVAHASDGSKTCAFSATCGINVTLSGTYYGNITASGSGTFNTIARASTISSVTSSVSVNGTNEVTVAISRKSSAFTHTVVFSFGSYSKTNTGVATSSSYAIPTSWLNAIPNATSGTAKVTVTTYSGSTKIGSAVSKNFTLTVPASVVPTFSSVGVADTTTNQTTFGNMVQGKSKPKFTITAAGALGSTITAYKTVFEGKTYTGATPTTSAITGSGTVSASITITDSRGRTATTTKSWAVAAYSPPKIISFQGFRCLADGTENYEGTYIKAFVNFSVSPVNNKNANAYTIEYKPKTGATWASLTSGAIYAFNDSIISASGSFGVDSTYEIRLSVSDSFQTVRSIFEIPTAFTLIDYHRNGRALSFGKVCEIEEGVEFGLPTFFSHAETPGSVKYLNGGEDLDAILEPGFYSIPTTEVSASLLNKPWTATSTGSLIVIREGNGMQKCQIGHQCSKDGGCIYERSYYTNAWGDWVTVHNGVGKILWTGGYYMTETHKITFSELASKQPSGIVLVFSEFVEGEAKNQTFSSFFVPKRLILAHPGTGNSFIMSTSNGAFFATKYLYIRDDGITGHANNGITITATSGITLTNNRFVLRYVFGV